VKKNDTDLLIAICDTLAGASTLSLKEVFRRKGVAPVSGFAWMNDPSVILPEYAGEQNITFRRAIALARKCAMQVATSGGLEHSSFEMVFRAGLPVWEMDPDSADMTPEERLDLGFEEAGVLRDEHGNRVQQMRRVMPLAQHIEKFIEAARAVEPSPAIEDWRSAEPKFNPHPEIDGLEAEPAPVTPEPAPAPIIARPEAGGPADVDGLTTEEIELLRRAASPSPLEADLARRAAEKMRQNAPQRSADNYGVGRTPGSGGFRVA
jgi:hypothetical protein